MNRFVTIIILAVSLFSSPQVFGQELKRMQASVVPAEDAGSIVVREENESILVVYSTIPDLSFDERNRGIISVENPYQGVYWVHLHPGTNRVTFTSEGYLPLQVRYYIERKQFKEVRIDPETAGEGESTGILVVMSQPSGATVYLDGMKMGQQTTAQLRSVRVGPHEVTVEKDQYLAYIEEVEIKEDEVTTVSAPLQPNFAPLRIESEPTGARIFLNNSPRGETPYYLERQPAGDYSIRLIHFPYYHDHDTTITVVSGTPTELLVELHPSFGSVQISSQPEEARVIANGIDDWGITPAEKDMVLSGTYSLHFEKELYASLDTSITVQDGQAVNMLVTLIPSFGSLTINSEPDSMRVFVDGIAQPGVTPLTLQLGLGQHAVEIRNELYEDFFESVIVRKGEARSIMATLVRKRGTLQLFPNPPEAAIFMNGDSLGIAAQVLKDYLTGEYQVEARLAGYQPLRQTVIVEPGRTKVVELNLAPITELPSGTVPITLQLRFISTDGTENKLEAGAAGAIWATIRNTGNRRTDSFTASVTTPYGSSISGVGWQDESDVGSIPPRDETVVRIPVEADLAVENQTIRLVVSILDADGLQVTSREIAFDIVSLIPATLAIGDQIGINDGFQGMSFGNNNGRLEPGEAAQITLLVRNVAEASLQDIILEIIPLAESQVYYISKDHRHKIGSLTPRAVKQVTFGIAVSTAYDRSSIPVRLIATDATGVHRYRQQLNIPVD